MDERQLVERAVREGELTAEEAESLSADELVDLLGDEEAEVAYQDQGSLDEPTQVTEPTDTADIGTPELQEEARKRSGVNRKREPFPWEVGPPRR